MRRVTAKVVAVMVMAATPVPPQLAAWLYPGSSALTPPSGGWNPAPVSLAGSARTFTEAQFHDIQTAVDWFPDTHPVMPAAVARGPAPEIGACAFCHGPNGEGRPENASLAGLPEEYLTAQGMAFRSGERHGVVEGWRPSSTMTRIAKGVSEADIAAAAAYYSKLPFVPMVKVVETPTVPRTAAQAFILVPAADGSREPTGNRIIEVADDFERFERRDPRATFTAYVPPGSVARGGAVAERIGCLECHSGMLGGWGPGRSPSYILRQLHAFRAGGRTDEGAAPMREVVSQLSDADMVDVAAWYAAQKP